jgi:hypothetical protein
LVFTTNVPTFNAKTGAGSASVVRLIQNKSNALSTRLAVMFRVLVGLEKNSRSAAVHKKPPINANKAYKY